MINYASSLFKYLTTVFFLCGIFVFGMIFFIMTHMTVDFSPLTTYQTGKPSIVLDDEGNEWARFQLDRREPIILEQMPKHLIQAFIAAEDWQFFNHAGISVKGIVRSTLVNVYHGRIVQGASTITQQLVKLLFFDSQKTFKRKIKEQLYALLIEYQCTKEQILQTYLNYIYFGCGIYGVEAACQRFWNCSATDITIDQAALLAGIVRSPGKYCPLIHPLSSQQRRNVVLSQMLKLSFITPEQYRIMSEKELMLNFSDESALAPHAQEMIRQQVEDLFGRKELYAGGLIIQTSLNKAIQEKANKAFSKHIMHLRNELTMPLDGALVSMDPETGEIKALIGGYQFLQSKFNRAVQAKRQLGSIFKPIVYAAALQQGLTFADTEIDEPLEIENGTVWAPRNHTRDFDGKITLAYALSHSNNIVAIKTFLKVGAQAVIKLAEKSNLKAQLNPYPSLALGCVDVSPMEATALFNIFAHDGIYVEPHLVKWIKDRWGTKIFKQAHNSKRVLESRISGQIAKVLELGINRVRRRFNTQITDTQIISKTGTTNDSRSCWFIGSTPTLTTGIYIGCDDNRALGTNVFPIHTAFPIWRGLYEKVDCNKKQFSYDPSLKEIWIDEKTGEQVYEKRAGIIPIYI